jgi:hypothetical protein
VTAACLPTLQRCGLLTAAESRGVEWLLGDGSPFAASIDAAETLHVHIKVDDTAALPEGEFLDAGAVLDHRKDGYVKFRFPDGLNAIFSHIRIAQEEAAVDDEVRRPRPYLDHVGVDLREETTPVRAVYDAVPDIGARFGWAHVAQGGERPVFCCHVSVERKHWLYPTCGALAGIPIEFAFGRLVTDTGKAGCDLRPAAPGMACDPATGCC